ncbi:MAG TPA: hypothetical protein VFK47_04360 [Ktedonobacteraceae bacterium]|nr:hypothetical protein [Ktedonobacteraceae bacterium]
MAAQIGMRLTFTPEDKSISVSSDQVREALGKIQNQINGGATAGNVQVNGKHDTEGKGVICRVKWSIDGNLDD